jgi:hypothetical protein
MKKPVAKIEPAVETKPERSYLVIAQSVPTLDAEGLHDDDIFLSDAGWEVREDVEDHVTYEKASGVLKLVGGQADENEHRVKWELSIHSNNTQVGYATITLRPGDMNGSTTQRLIKEAVESGQAEVNKWTDALAEARRALGI